MKTEIERKGIEQKFFELSTKVVTENSLKLYDLDYFSGNGLLRLFIYKEETQSADIEDCILIDHALSPYIEELEWMPENLTLEVSSPGIYRKIRSRKHLEMALGQSIELSLKNSLEESGAKRKKQQIKCVLKELKEDSLFCLKNEEKMEIKYSNIKKANLEPESNRG